MRSKKEPICDHDCFHCPYDDCINEELTAADYSEIPELWRERTKKEEKIAARQRETITESSGFEQANEIRQIRANLGLTQKDFGLKFGVSQGTVSSWEHGVFPVGVDVAGHLVANQICADVSV